MLVMIGSTVVLRRIFIQVITHKHKHRTYTHMHTVLTANFHTNLC